MWAGAHFCSCVEPPGLCGGHRGLGLRAKGFFAPAPLAFWAGAWPLLGAELAEAAGGHRACVLSRSQGCRLEWTSSPGLPTLAPGPGSWPGSTPKVPRAAQTQVLVSSFYTWGN